MSQLPSWCKALLTDVPVASELRARQDPCGLALPNTRFGSMRIPLTVANRQPRSGLRGEQTCRAVKRPSVPQRLLQSTAASAAAIILTAGSSHAYIDKVGSFGASGFVFKDTVDVISVQDTEVPGVVLYVSEMQRSFSDKLANNFFNDPSQASLGCVATAGIPEIDPSKFKSKDGKEIISQGRNMSFFQQKTLRLRRLYDSNQQVMVYVAYSTRLTSAQDEGGASTGRYKYATMMTLSQLGSVAGEMAFLVDLIKNRETMSCRTSICAVPVKLAPPPPPPPAPAQ